LCFQKDSLATPEDPAEDNGEHDFASYHTRSSMISPRQKMDFPAEYRKKELL
jgi:hypothetical protein